MELYTIVFVALALSMDAFSLSLAYGTININKKDGVSLSIVVGLYHFFMPLLGNYLGSSILHHFPIPSNLIILIILLFIGINLIKESFEEQTDFHKMTFLELLTFGFAVSMDSFSIGIAIETITDNPLLSSFLFSIFSFSFTLLGLLLGKKVSQLLGKFATFLGGILLIGIGIFTFFH